MFGMHRIISISLSVLLVMSLCTWSSSKAYNVKLSNYNQKQQQNQQKGQVSELNVIARNRTSLYNEVFRRTHFTEDSLLPFFSHDPSKPDGPEYWEDAAPSCGGNYQSPISLHSRDAVSVRYRSLTINNADSLPTSIKLQNDGHSVKYTPTYANGEQVTISGGPLADEYVLHHFHFHWGSTNDKGSEHYLNGRQFASEIHLVHYNKKYRSFDDAAAQPQGLAVIGFFYQISSRLQDSFLDQGLDAVRNPNDTTTLREEDTYSISDIIGDTPFEFISYAGSLTTPPCYETVTWIVGTEILEMSETEIQAFRRLRDSSNSQMVDNFRPLQKRNGRKLFLFHDDL
ncbi:carbonic anhydrase-like [Culicoides brevitarsis]|uniref:carbonic anhydrase-like n=1 Tax=Culicoides brevitarsis TaxID=469753 RepID=UPI00307BD05C